MIIRNERDVKREVKRILTKHDWFWWMPPANGFGKVGISDVQAIKAGVFLTVETKYGDNKLTHHQRAFLESVNAESGFGFVVSEKTLDAFESFLVNFGESVREVATNKQMPNTAGAALLDAIRVLQASI